MSSKLLREALDLLDRFEFNSDGYLRMFPSEKEVDSVREKLRAATGEASTHDEDPVAAKDYWEPPTLEDAAFLMAGRLDLGGYLKITCPVSDIEYFTFSVRLTEAEAVQMLKPTLFEMVFQPNSSTPYSYWAHRSYAISLLKDHDKIFALALHCRDGECPLVLPKVYRKGT